MALVVAKRPPLVAIEFGVPSDDILAEALWRETGARAAQQGSPSLRLVARDPASGRFLGVADCFHTFPPEDALGAVAVSPLERKKGVGTALLRALARFALGQGKRNMAGFVAEDDVASWRLLCSAEIPLRLYDVEGGFYVELDLVSLMRELFPQQPLAVSIEPEGLARP